MRLSGSLIPILLVGTLILVGVGSPCYGCSCLGYLPACEEFWITDVVFAGKVLEIRTIPNSLQLATPEPSTERSVRFRVDRLYRGSVGAEVEIVTNIYPGVCGYDFKLNKRYLVFVNRSAKDGSLRASGCKGTHQMFRGDEAVRYLESLPTRPHGSWIFGSVESYFYPEDDPSHSKVRPMAGVTYTVDGEGRHFEMTTDKKGRFRVEGLEPGEYNYTVTLPGDSDSPRNGKIALQDKGCVELSLYYKAAAGVVDQRK